MTRSRNMRPPKLRKCVNCGRTAYRTPASPCRKWDPTLKKNAFCGIMNVVKDENRNITNLGEWKNGQES